MTESNDALRNAFAKVSAATVMTQLFKRGLRSAWMRGVSPLESPPVRFCGQAFTVRFVPSREHEDTMATYADPEYPARKAIEIAPEGSVLVMDGHGDAGAAMLGDILAARLKKRNLAGVVTDAGVRDAQAVIEVGLPIQCSGPAAPASITRHKAVDLDVPVACGGIAVYPGDWVVADGDGVVVVPQNLAQEVADAAVEQETLETWILSKVQEGRSTAGLYPMNAATQAEYEAWRQSQGDH